MNQAIRKSHWPYLVTLTFSLVLGGPAAGDNTACEAALEAALVDYYTKHDTPHDMADAYTASKAAFDHTIRKGYEATIASLRFLDEMGTSSDIVAEVEVKHKILDLVQAINAATAAASEAAEAAEAAHALWIALGAGTNRHSTLEAMNIEHAAFMSAVHLHRTGKEFVNAFIDAAVYAGASRADRGKGLDIFSTILLDTDSVASIYESLADFEEIGAVGMGEFVRAVKAFHDAGEEANLRAENAATTLDTMVEIASSSAACR